MFIHRHEVTFSHIQHTLQPQPILQVFSHVLLATQLNECFLKSLKFLVMLVVQKLEDWNAIVELESERMHQVVNHNDVLE